VGGTEGGSILNGFPSPSGPDEILSGENFRYSAAESAHSRRVKLPARHSWSSVVAVDVAYAFTRSRGPARRRRLVRAGKAATFKEAQASAVVRGSK
jgi:hypothetical protein